VATNLATVRAMVAMLPSVRYDLYVSLTALFFKLFQASSG
jgi:hypothetical protein